MPRESINLVSKAYLDEQVLAEFLVLALVVSQLLDHLVLGFLVELLDECVDGSHLLDSLFVLLLGLLNPQLDLVLLQLVSVVLDQALLLLSNVLLLLDGELLLGLVLDGLHALVTMGPNELDHGGEHFGCFVVVHIARYVLLIINLNKQRL